MKTVSILVSVVATLGTQATARAEMDTILDTVDERQLQAAMTYAGIPPEQHRGLQLEFLGILCAKFGAMLPGGADCQCDIGFGLFVACAFQEPLCQGDFCTQPVLTAGFNYLTQEVTLEVCTNQSTNNGIPMPGACFDFGLRNVESGGVNRRLGKRKKREGKKNGLETTLDHCTASARGEVCNSCRPCNKGRGYEFDCSNIDERMVQSHCIELHMIGSFVEGQREMTFLPVLDESFHD